MGRCSNAELLKKIGINKIDKQATEVTFTVLNDLPDCRRINTKDFVKVSGTYTYNRYERPINRFECNRDGCVNTGTLTLQHVEGGIEDVMSALYKMQSDATEYAAGALIFYVKPTVTPLTISVEISDVLDYDTEKGVALSSDIYNVTINSVMSDGFAPVFIDLTKTPDETKGDGWEVSSYAYIGISAEIEYKSFGISSISAIESLSDFETNDVIKIGCLSEVGGTFDVEAIEATCLNTGYNDDISAFEYTVTGKTATPNYWKLCPLTSKGKEVEGFRIETVRRTVIDEGNGFGLVTIEDPYQKECGFWAVQVADDCNISDTMLTRLTIPTEVSVDEGHYLLSEYDELGVTCVVVNKNFVGKDLLISYPQKKEIEERVGSLSNLNSVRAKMAVPFVTTDGVEEIHVFDHVLITSFPETINEDETEFSFTISIQKAPDGTFFKVNRIV